VAKSLEEARKKLADEYGQVRRKFDRIHDAFDQVVSAGMEDDVYGRLKHLEDVVKEVRDGGIVGSGANGHRRALAEYEEIKQSS
jgi:hypothetical protein